ncbi:methionine--tRNA ligase [Candidatus Woesebacteria bacterium]|nr:methionine--tRNA ligase [Candidatus Woesebacteria bacterium]
MNKVTFKQFKQLDIRIGTVVKAEVPKWSHWVIKLAVDLGEEIGERTVFAGVLGFYKPKELEGRQMPFLVNIEPKKIGPEGDFSEGMMLAANLKLISPVEVAEGEESDEKPVLFELSEKVPNGTKIM